jgi:hypothetical protein
MNQSHVDDQNLSEQHNVVVAVASETRTGAICRAVGTDSRPLLGHPKWINASDHTNETSGALQLGRDRTIRLGRPQALEAKHDTTRNTPTRTGEVSQNADAPVRPREIAIRRADLGDRISPAATACQLGPSRRTDLPM